MIYELRVYQAMPGRLPALNDLFADPNVGIFKKVGVGVLGFWTDEIGTAGQLTSILHFPSVADREASWNAHRSHPDHVFARTEEGEPLVAQRHNTLMLLTAYSPEPKITSNIQELRIYDAVPGKLPALHDRFANHTIRMFKKHGMDVVGFWTDEVGTTNRLVYMLGYPSLADRERSWATFRTDPEWLKALVESEANGALTTKSHSTILRPTPYSPR